MIWRRLRDWFNRRAEDRIIGRCMLCGGRRGDAAVMQADDARGTWVHLECPGTSEMTL